MIQRPQRTAVKYLEMISNSREGLRRLRSKGLANSPLRGEHSLVAYLLQRIIPEGIRLTATASTALSSDDVKGLKGVTSGGVAYPKLTKSRRFTGLRTKSPMGLSA